MKVPLKDIKIIFLIITSCFLNSVYCVFLFGIDLTAPVKIVKNGVGKISKPQNPRSTLFLPMLESAKTNETQENNILTSKPIEDDQSPSISQKVSEPLESNLNTGSKLESDVETLGWSENGVDYTTESDNETTTDINTIGGPPPAVLASLLGSG
ncbi:uncharacterized protein LOC125226562 [Leguminivora glycinivorella]|uniref:uncharacterized protein LOC125226562 n=1 Tax=Leguminivora glycinivorella TaxID=1035111 RepID=UPI00200CED8F|nr:uncharacterized protein LOC125226562 [Leguminivora glycinivorella]